MAAIGPMPAIARITLTVDGHELAVFNELVGIVQEHETTAEYLQATDKGTVVSKHPGRPKPPEVVLKRAASDRLDLWAWHEAVRLGQPDARRGVSLTLYAADGKAVMRFWLERAWPRKLELQTLKAGASSPLIETVTLTCDHVQRLAA